MTTESMFNDNWLQLQRQYWDSWADMSRKAMGVDGGAKLTAPWEGSLDHWWKALSPGAPDSSKSFMDKMMEQGKSFFRLSETLASQSSDGTANNGLAIWTKVMEDMQKRFSGTLSDSGDGAHKMMAFWEMPFDNIQRMMSSMSPMPGDMLRNMSHDPFKDHLDRALTAPGLGYNREKQGRQQDLMRCAMAYQTAMQEYTNFYSGLGNKAMERMGAYLQDAMKNGKSVDSARALYDNWIACCEAVYAEEVAKPEYAEIHGKLINAQMVLKSRMAAMTEEQLSALNIPSRREMHTLEDRLQEARRQNKKLIGSLHTLEKQVATLMGESTSPATALKAPTADADAKTASARRKTAAKSDDANS